MLSNWHVQDKRCGLRDVAPTVPDLFGIEKPQYTDGKVWTFSEGVQQ